MCQYSSSGKLSNCYNTMLHNKNICCNEPLKAQTKQSAKALKQTNVGVTRPC